MKRSNNEHSLSSKPKKGFFIRDILERPVSIPISLDDNKENIPPHYLSKDLFTKGQHKLEERQTQNESNAESIQNHPDILCRDNSYLKFPLPYTHVVPDFRQITTLSVVNNALQTTLPVQTTLSTVGDIPENYEARHVKKWECNKCERYFNRPSLLDRHARTHTGERPFTCKTCQKSFSSSSSLNTHSRIHTGERPHICEICGKCFTASSNLYYHRMTHFEQKPHQCSFCEKSFPTPGDLRNHLPIHTSLWPLMCPCGRGFVKANPFRNHLLTHLGLPRYQCKLCSKSFNLLRLLKSHLSDEHKLSACECSSYWQTHLNDDGKSECHRLLELVKQSYQPKDEL